MKFIKSDYSFPSDRKHIYLFSNNMPESVKTYSAAVNCILPDNYLIFKLQTTW